jgi:uncharacterized protein (DUF2267 family)
MLRYCREGNAGVSEVSAMDKQTFFKTVARRVGCEERRAEALTFTVFQELRDRLTRGEAAHVDAQLPAGLKPLWEFLDRPGRHVRKVHEPQFVGEVRCPTKSKPTVW